ncbi:MAG: hypothetical protein GOVbin4933_9 [Prokaryotic dsDNA virus sp.]|nr:MAG: hypothetical protein GOVbin4933_9 [Prokaryotic dsDNA virus sp.]|tara:strand:+ start:880 stop:1395 length:516 start_codon:yes stop_codon:yes gene_type:complete
MTKGLQRSLSRGPKATQNVVTDRLVLSVPLTFTGATGLVAMATAAIAGLPEGNILLLGATANLTFTGPTSADLADDFQGDYGIGSTPADNNTITGTDVDLVGSTVIAAATTEVSANNRGVNAAQVVLDNTDGTGEMNLNALLDAGEVADGQSVVVTVTGSVDVAYIVLGDD